MSIFFRLLVLTTNLLQAVQVLLNCVNIRYDLFLHLLLIICFLFQFIDLIIIVGLLNLVHKLLTVTDHIFRLLIFQKQFGVLLILLLLIVSGGFLKLLGHFLCQSADYAIGEVL